MRFSKVSSKDSAGRANIIPAANPGEEVWGVVFEISDAEVLDKAEAGYDRRSLEVVIDGKPARVETYIARPERTADNLKPSTEYLGYIIDGAAEHGLPTDYRKKLEAIEVAAPVVKKAAKTRR